MKRLRCNIEICQISTICNTRNARDFNLNHGEFYYDFEGIVLIDNKKIEVSYDNEDGDNFKYFGNEEGDGHWRLKRSDNKETASLHSFHDLRTFEGYWNSEETGDYGFWRILTKEVF